MLDDKVLMKDEDLENVAGGVTFECKRWKDDKGQEFVTLTLRQPMGRHQSGRSRGTTSRTLPLAEFEKFRKAEGNKHIFLDSTGNQF